MYYNKLYCMCLQQLMLLSQVFRPIVVIFKPTVLMKMTLQLHIVIVIAASYCHIYDDTRPEDDQGMSKHLF